MIAMAYFQGKKVLVCGGLGFLGSNIAIKLASLGAEVTCTTRNAKENKRLSEDELKRIIVKEANLLDPNQCLEVCKGQEIVINCAFSGLRSKGEKSDTEIFKANVLLELNLLEAAAKNKVRKYLMISSAFVYPGNLKKPAKEEDIFSGDVHNSKFSYGWAKRACEAAAKIYSKQHSLRTLIVRPSNIYGPKDNFFSERSTVIASFIKKAFTGEDITISGSGNAIRNFIYVEDCVEGILTAIEKHDSSDPINICSKKHINIKELAQKIILISGKKVKIKFDKTADQGPLFLSPDYKKAKNLIGFEAKTSLKEGLKKTIKWFEENCYKI